MWPLKMRCKMSPPSAQIPLPFYVVKMHLPFSSRGIVKKNRRITESDNLAVYAEPKDAKPVEVQAL